MRKYESYVRALDNLAEGMRIEPPYTVVEQTGIVGLFEICYELSWKLMKEMLEFHGRIPGHLASPRTIMKLAYQHGMISDENIWMAILKTRNELAHTYSDKDSLAAIERIRSEYFPAFSALKDTVEREWMIAE